MSRNLRLVPDTKPIVPAEHEMLAIDDYLDIKSVSFLVTASGESEEAGIKDGDLMLVSKSLKPRPGDWVIAQREDGQVISKVPVTSHLRLVGAEAQDLVDEEIVGVITFKISALRGSEVSRRQGADF